MSKRSASGLSNRYTSRDSPCFQRFCPLALASCQAGLRADQASLLAALRRELFSCRGSIWRSSAAALSLTGLGAGAAHAEYLECELIDRRRFRSHSEARIAVFQFIEGFYNPSRRHSAPAIFRPSNTKGKMIA